MKSDSALPARSIAVGCDTPAAVTETGGDLGLLCGPQGKGCTDLGCTARLSSACVVTWSVSVGNSGVVGREAQVALESFEIPQQRPNAHMPFSCDPVASVSAHFHKTMNILS